MNIASLEPPESDPTHPRSHSCEWGRTCTQSPRYENGISGRYQPEGTLQKNLGKILGIEWSGLQVHPPQKVLEARV